MLIKSKVNALKNKSMLRKDAKVYAMGIRFCD